MDAIGKELLGTVIAPETVIPPENVCKAVHVFGMILNIFITYPDRLLCKVVISFNVVLNSLTADMGKELSGIEILPDETVKPLLNVGDAFTVNNLFELAPIVVSRVIDTGPPDTVIPL